MNSTAPTGSAVGVADPPDRTCAGSWQVGGADEGWWSRERARGSDRVAADAPRLGATDRFERWWLRPRRLPIGTCLWSLSER